MAVTEIKFQVLDVGQGSANFIEIYDGTSLVHTVLIDLGTTSGSAQGALAVDYIAAKLNTMTKAGTPAPRIDLLLLTHSDTDHVNLLTKLLDKFPTTDTHPLKIDKVRYGGDSALYKKGKKKTSVLVELKGYCGDIKPPSPASRGVDKLKKWVVFWQVEDVKIYLVAANVPEAADDVKVDGSKKRKRSTQPSAYAINTCSLVNLIEWDGYWYATAGDATATTLTECNKVLDEAPTPFSKTFMMTLPHHGSKNTIFNLRKATDDPGDEAVEVVDDFAKSLAAENVCASANRTNHHHPSLFVIDIFNKYLDDSFIFWKDPSLADDRHLYTTWVDKTITKAGKGTAYPATWRYASLETAVNFYTTLYTREGEIPIPNYVYPPEASAALTTKVPTGTAGGVRWNFYMDATQKGLSRHPDNAVTDATPMASRASRSKQDSRTGAALPPVASPKPRPHRPASLPATTVHAFPQRLAPSLRRLHGVS